MRRALAVLSVVLAASVMVNASLAHDANMLLEVWINGRTAHQVVEVQSHGGELFATARELARAGLRLDESRGAIRLSSLPGISFQIDSVRQRLLISAAADRLPVQDFDLRPSFGSLPQSTAARGASLVYDLSAAADDLSHVKDSASAGATLGVHVFAPDTLFTATGFASYAGGQHSGARLDTSLEFDDAALPRAIVVGDAISGALSWSRALRFGGLQIASDYALRPDLVTFPLPSFFGRASVPQTVDVLVGAAKVFEQDVDPGPFALHDIPIVTGGGSATVVTTDVLGRETSQTISLYTTTELLAPGLAEYSIDAGFLRDGYGEQSFDYRTPMTSLMYRRGMNGFTLGMHAEAAQGLGLGGGEVALSLGGIGALSVAGAYSSGAKGDGHLASLALQARARAVNGFASVEATTAHYQDVAGLQDGPPPRLRIQMGASMGLPYGSLGMSWVRECKPDPSDEMIASYSLSAGGGWFVGVTGLHDFAGHDWAAQIFLGVPIGGGMASASYSAGSGSPTALAQFNAPADPDGGLGYSATAGTAGADEHLEGDASWIGPHAALSGGLAADGNTVALRAGASGALFFVGSELFATRQPDGAVALVQAGAPDVRIYRDNREVAISDSDGEALLTGLVPYTENRLGVDPRDYPMASIVANSEQTVVPQRSSAVVVDLAPHERRFALVIVRLPDGTAPRPGTAVTQMPSGAPLMVGRDGEIFIPDLRQDEDLSLAFANRSCVLHVDLPKAAAREILRIGPLLCRPGVPA
ncbi:MAG: fimbria/pilus outer membrane usher protein [Rhizomicrobium sp.]